MEIDPIREKIDKIDEKILNNLNQRAKQVLKISNIKKKKKIRRYSPERESKILKKLSRINKGPLGAEDIRNIFTEILSVSRSQKGQLDIAYLGPEGTFTHLAARKKFGKKCRYLPAEGISDVFYEIEKGKADFGVVPVENSTEGVVNHTLDMFFTSNLSICAEITLNISHFLLGRLNSKIKRVYSNPQVFSQCRRWLAANLPEAELISASSTAAAAKKAKSDRWGACIGGKILADLYGLDLIASSIEDLSSNYTRFLIIASCDSAVSGSDKTSLLFSVKDEVGALYDVLSFFRQHNINLTKIESRPSKKKPWEYYFFVDLEGHRESTRLKKSLEDLNKKCVFVKVLGSYPREK
ncbi:MAG: prephenate dehydratase [Candidatus Omnitrophica bacterium]|nr:prephenate dehydratase [Candidatus Omnitrophota bacterium]MCF7891556.1 prephenate dehydratase [Candidatus Omnitrophota bacterium]MCF7895761.1 prephenate dehydratase [Candidatus Omnitrophota bacterium]MCF7897332.1 prephenate dehydratase [Candidatus Omnitrophota bacterium]MCF7909698.1 prephenate dehydratase [Candidatus Omnitrophota bacterium]